MIIAPSVLSLDFSDINSQIKQVNESKAKWIHYDVMDGHFVKNLTFGPDILKALKKISPLFFDVHLMVTDPMYYAPIFIEAKADLITFHYEVLTEEQILELIKHIHSKGIKVGISIKPETNVEVLDKFLDKVDLVLIMSVQPGFGGQGFIESSLDKITYLKDYKIKNNLNYYIEVDGGINNTTINSVKNAGVDVCVSGSYIFKGDIKKNVESLL